MKTNHASTLIESLQKSECRIESNFNYKMCQKLLQKLPKTVALHVLMAVRILNGILLHVLL